MCVSGVRVWGRPRLGGMDGVKVALGIDRKEWRALVHMKIIEFNMAIFAWQCVLSDRPPSLWWIITWRGVGCRYMMRYG